MQGQPCPAAGTVSELDMEGSGAGSFWAAQVNKVLKELALAGGAHLCWRWGALAFRCWRGGVRRAGENNSINLVDSASSHTLVSKTKPCTSKYKSFTLKLRMAHYISYSLFDSPLLLG